MTFKFGPSHFSLVIGHFFYYQGPQIGLKVEERREMEDDFSPTVKSWES